MGRHDRERCRRRRFSITFFFHMDIGIEDQGMGTDGSCECRQCFVLLYTILRIDDTVILATYGHSMPGMCDT